MFNNRQLTAGNKTQRLGYRLAVVLMPLCAMLMGLSPALYAATSPPPEDVLTVSQGQTLLLEYDGVDRVAVGDSEILQVEVLNTENEVLLIALSPGITDLRLWAGDDEPLRYVVRVHDGSELVSIEDIRALVNDIEGVSVEALGDSIVLSGRVRNQQDLIKLEKIAAAYPGVDSYVNPPAFEREPTILMHARLLEIRRSALKQLGVSWDQVINGPILGYLGDFATNPLFRLTEAPGLAAGTSLPLDAGTQSFTGISTSISSVINLLVQNGNARLLAEPTLVCVSGGQADFLVGGEVPIPSRDANGSAAVDFKEFGIILDFSPIADADRFIHTDVAVEVSSLDPSIEVLGIPGFATRKTNTKMTIAEGDTMVIAGLVSREDAKNVDKTPLLGDIPILGELFKSREFRNQESELVILITPSIIEAGSQTNQNYRQRFDNLAETSRDDVRFKLLD